MSTLYPADISIIVPKALRQSGYYYVVLFDKECRFLWTNTVFNRKYPAPRGTIGKVNRLLFFYIPTM